MLIHYVCCVYSLYDVYYVYYVHYAHDVYYGVYQALYIVRFIMNIHRYLHVFLYIHCILYFTHKYRLIVVCMEKCMLWSPWGYKRPGADFGLARSDLEWFKAQPGAPLITIPCICVSCLCCFRALSAPRESTARSRIHSAYIPHTFRIHRASPEHPS